MLSTFINAWKIVDIRRKLIFTILIFIVFRFASHIPVPGVDAAALKAGLESTGGGIFSLLDTFTGGSLGKFSVCAMGIMPYINASIIIQLLGMVIPYFERLSKEGQEGRKKMVQYTRYGTVFLGAMQAIFMIMFFKGYMINPNFASYAVVVIALTAGTTFLMWLGELITENGVGNGISLIIFAGIVSRLPHAINSVMLYVQQGQIFGALLFLVIALVIVAGIIFIQEGQRRIPVQYAKRVIGRKMYGGQSTHIPIKVNQAGVIPIIFASCILAFPTTIASYFPQNGFAQFITHVLGFTHPVHMFLYAILILFFTYFYTAVTFNPSDVAENMKKNGGFVPGLRPGRPTAEYLDRVLSRITIAGAVFLAVIALMPGIAAIFLKGMNVYFGGTSLLIVVGVALDTMKQIESQMLIRHYQGFMK